MKKKLIKFLLKNEAILRSFTFYLRLILIIPIIILLLYNHFYLALFFLIISNSSHLFDLYLESISKRLILKIDLSEFIIESVTIIFVLILLIYKNLISLLNIYLLLTLFASFMVLSLIFYFRSNGLFIPKTGNLHLIWGCYIIPSYFIIIQSFFGNISLFLSILLSYFYFVPIFLIYVISMKKR